MRRYGLLIAFTLLAVTACGSDEPPTAAPPQPTTTPAATPTAAASSAAVPTPSTTGSDVIEFSVDGAGPYQLGTTLEQLQAAGQLDQVAKGTGACSDNTNARGTGTWADLYLSFRADGLLYLVVNRSPSVPTPSGAWLGTTLAELDRIYKGVPGQKLTHGSRTAFFVPTLSGRGMLFELDSSKRVVSMMAADSTFLETRFKSGAEFC